MTTLPDLEPAALEAAAKAIAGSDWDIPEDDGRDDWRAAYTADADAAVRAYLAARSTAPEAGKAVTLRQLQAAHIERQAEWCPDQVPDLSFRGNEMAGEVGEACNVIKKLERERHGWRGSRATKEQLAEELGDVIHTAILCAITAGIDIEPATVAKFNSTSEKNGLSTFLSALASVPAPSGAEPIDDETYEIGKRDGYEDAVQDLDLATGGDGEFRGSTIPGETVDVPAMKRRIIERFTATPHKPENADWPDGKLFTFADDPGEHDPCYVVMPDGCMLPVNHHAGEGVDIARAKFIVAACNAGLRRTSSEAEATSLRRKLEEAYEKMDEIYEECAGVAVPARDTAFEAIEAYRSTIRLLHARAADRTRRTLSGPSE